MIPRTVAVVGGGTIASSLTLALARHGVRVRLVPENLAGAGAGAAAGTGAPDRPADLAVLAVPPSRVATVLAHCRRVGLAEAYTDMTGVDAAAGRDAADGHEAGSDGTGYGDAAAGHATGSADATGWVGSADATGSDDATRPDDSDYLAGHPLTDLTGSDASAGLFEGRPWVLVPTPATSRETLNRVLGLTALCGAVPVVMDHASHDAAMARTAHAPRLLTALLAARFHPPQPHLLRLTEPDLCELLRPADLDTELWSDLLRGNAAAVSAVLREVSADLDVLLGALEGVDSPDAADREQSRKQLAHLLEQGRDGYAAVAAHHSGRAGGVR
ncbi:prephenate dehydrogenase/arogenate dehydrogenase family protein [Streptomyces sp. Go40/10]|uniref:prephenate dehydrogenase dimerization domain-containing protein n=1 Tax=Streptomyces sp. Go40/10 TaxID=2825844 RepID=UPI001E618366|nr:prephenate dehydrogenase dimerization domain-containing protein [Streptomyces sp. Go40/10]UFR01490.1 prephenate dehydrogenase/arogenate dehydrogenase family protein [Streptomyces sp. Go40/10]